MPVTLAPPHGRPATERPTAPTADPTGTAAPPGPDGRAWLSRLAADPPPVAPAPLPPADRSAAEHDAVARALGSPDLFVLDAADRAARERLVADLARAAAARGDRVLVLSPDSTAADRLAEAVAAGHAVRVVRTLAPDEPPYRSTPGASRLTSAQAGPGRVDHLRRDAVAALTAAQTEATATAAVARAAAELRELAGRFAAAGRDRADLLARRDALDAEVRAELAGTPTTPAFAADLDRIRAAEEAATAPARAELQAAAARRAEKEAALAAARRELADAVADAGKKQGILARLWGKAKPPADPAELDRHLHEVEREVRELADQEARRRAEADAAGVPFAAEREKRAEAEVAARAADLDAKLAALAADRDDAAGRYALKVKELDKLGLPAPAQLTAEAAERVHAEAAGRQRAADARVAAARARIDELNRGAGDAARRFLADARVVVGHPRSLNADPTFQAVQPADGPPFGLLILDHAEELTEGAFDGLARLASRCVLAGDAAPPEPRPAPPGRAARPPDPTLLNRLARRFDRSPWAAEGGRFVFKLRHLPPEERRRLAREPVLDRPDIELGFAAGPDGPVLAEVAFPLATPVPEAKAFLAAEVSEILLRPCGPSYWRRDDLLTAYWPAADAGGGPAAWVDLEPGVREKVVGGFTAAVTFDPAAGWDADTAAAWLAARLPADPGRVASLPRPAPPALAPPPRPVGVG